MDFFILEHNHNIQRHGYLPEQQMKAPSQSPPLGRVSKGGIASGKVKGQSPGGQHPQRYGQPQANHTGEFVSVRCHDICLLLAKDRLSVAVGKLWI